MHSLEVASLRKIVAVEEGLTPITLLLKRQGYEVVCLDSDRWRTADAVVISGVDKDFLEMESTSTDAPVITAAGKTPQEVLHTIEHSYKMR